MGKEVVTAQGLWPWMFSPGPALPGLGGHMDLLTGSGPVTTSGSSCFSDTVAVLRAGADPMNPRSTEGAAPHGPPGKQGSPQLDTWPTKALSSQGWRQQDLWQPFPTNSLIQDVQLAPPAHSWLCLPSPAVTCVIQQSDLLLLHCPAPSLGRKQRKLETISVAFLGTVERSTIFTSIS